ncbi:leukotriene C4 synthase [Cynoglossus semilaevis]|uniref:Leukotriene C4 synthase n=1 Tax=Cynoglossus semilaevis TaxID=244447 RepID=A0A3P8VWV9_CYNSE|nr:leukotriene C4 synthase [Cynoglossus semilaevis]
MLGDALGLAAVTVLAVLEQAYFSMQVIYARRKYSVSPPVTTGPPEFDRVFRAQVNCSEYFPIFITLLWISGIFFSQALSSLCGLLYLYARLRYFIGYSQSSHGRLGPIYLSGTFLWILIGFSCLGIVISFIRVYVGVDIPLEIGIPLALSQSSARF